VGLAWRTSNASIADLEVLHDKVSRSSKVVLEILEEELGQEQLSNLTSRSNQCH
jgi:hypothetical protein